MNCAACGKLLTEQTNTEDCPNTPMWHGKHTAMVTTLSDYPWQKPRHKSSLIQIIHRLWKSLQRKQLQ